VQAGSLPHPVHSQPGKIKEKSIDEEEHEKNSGRIVKF
jgi:hypothetical protein